MISEKKYINKLLLISENKQQLEIRMEWLNSQIKTEIKNQRYIFTDNYLSK